VTGNANATGNVSNTNITQTANGNASVPGGLGGILIVNQSAAVVNNGTASASTGGNSATGNGSINSATNGQDASGGGSIANNSGGASNSSGGNANITTGNATSTGNSSNTTTNQVADLTAGGSLGGIIIANQTATVSNSGTADANTGDNTATGNGSTNSSNAVQGAVSGAGPPGQAVASNDGQANNSSNGTATIGTGNANAVGNSSTTNITQSVSANVTGSLGGIVLVNQTAAVSNSGSATANTGGNNATGNMSGNDATNVQSADSSAATGSPSVAANFGTASNDSNGSASIRTGNANAVGNASSTAIAQGVSADPTLAIVNQSAGVSNSGDGIANSGGNTAGGNFSTNSSTNVQDATSPGAADNTVPGNFGEAKNNSNGAASIVTGAANAVGNASSTAIAQGVSLLGTGDGFALVTQDAEVENDGTGIANSGLNIAGGNASDNTATNIQSGVSGDGGTSVAGNFGTASNTSNGASAIVTGAASAVGNASSTSIAQSDPTITGDGFIITDQTALVANEGLAIANSGLNAAVGNASTNDASNVQASDSGAADGNTVAANFGTASNWSDGSANIDTGAATSTGNASTTGIFQASDSAIGGSGFEIIGQTAGVVNAGLGIANSGLNVAGGNISDNTVTNVQTATTGDSTGDDPAIANNDGVASNWSNGASAIVTGDATGTGSTSDTAITQLDPAITGDGFAIVTQVGCVDNSGLGLIGDDCGFGRTEEDVVPAQSIGGIPVFLFGLGFDVLGVDTPGVENVLGFAAEAFDSLPEFDLPIGDIGFGGNLGIANSGLNLAAGNASTNDASNVQDATADGDPVANNTGHASNTSIGAATIVTGCATATGNVAHTAITQGDASNIGGAGFVIVDQAAEVDNAGIGVANTGLNAAVGNLSDNTVTNVQTATAADDAADVDVIASNIGSASNWSNGAAAIVTGGATATGNDAHTSILQVDPAIAGTGFVIVGQDATVDNFGLGVANSGLNLGVGNASTNDATNVQDATATGTDAAGSVVANNTGDPSNWSDGSANIDTGCACAVGNTSVTDLTQLSDATIGDAGFAIIDQTQDVTNTGTAIANTGLNVAAGNLSDNTVTNVQTATADGTAGAASVTANNTGSPTNWSNGAVAIVTGNAFALGNLSGTGGDQVINVDGGDFALVTQDKTVDNDGTGIANSGLNAGVGNASVNDSTNVQDAAAAGGDDNLVANNIGDPSNTSNGAASIVTGDATAFGNVSGTGAAIPPIPAFGCGCHHVVVPPVVVVSHKPVTPAVVTVAAETPVVGALPRTGASVLYLALAGLLMLLLGLSLTWKASQR